ncbi:unnamed protein product [Rhizoctonia solani]|uniref:G domain-containing protein n=1 Tax=Rhizoctonia solani TaxID=456999 RepID=A0A8H2WN82_9AGAM|nr:unnamed protein product [Rhizoctonia solani]
MSPQNTGLEPLNILVFGPTGVGKSTIINLLTSGHLTVDDSLESCTQKVEAASIQYQGRQINYFDTPGFDDSCLTSAEQLALIGSFVSGLYEAANQAPNIHGILYVHRITDNKMAGSTLRNLRILEKLLGPDAFKNLVFVTNMWDSQPDPKHVKFEQELITNPKYFESAIANGARAGVDYRICKDASEAQARERLSDLFLDSSPVTLQIQRDMVDNKSALWATTAGRFVNEEVKAIIKTLRELINELKFELAALSGGGEGRKKRIVLEQEEAEKNYEQAKK